jgi:hypothetical protein
MRPEDTNLESKQATYAPSHGIYLFIKFDIATPKKRRVFDYNRTLSDELASNAKQSLALRRNTYVDKIL